VERHDPTPEQEPPSQETAADEPLPAGALAPTPDLTTLVARQAELLEAWLLSPDAHTTARRLLARRRLDRQPAELLDEAWIRIRRSLTDRTDPLPDLTDEAHAARYAARVLDNLSRDWVRAAARRSEVALFEDAAPAVIDDHSAFEARLVLERLLHAVAARGSSGVSCSGCPDAVVVATALEVVHLVLAGHDGGDRGRSWIDQLLHVAVDRVDGGVQRTEAARNQRKSRCGRCASQLLTASAGDLVGSPS
jgi:hypothetical protein